MLKISKMADYGTMILSCMARSSERLWQAKQLAEVTGVPAPMVSKILKALSKGQLLVSSRGKSGGYRLSRVSDKITLAQIVRVLDEDIALTECSGDHGACRIHQHCHTRHHWNAINRFLEETFSRITLADLTHQLPHWMRSQVTSPDWTETVVSIPKRRNTVPNSETH